MSIACNVVFAALVAAFGVRRLAISLSASGRDDGGRVYAEERRSLFSAMAAAGKKGGTLFVGDSLTDRGEWAEMFGEGVANRGVAGETTADVLARAPDLAAQSPARVFLMVGTNDLIAGEPIERIVPRYVAIVEALRSGAPSAKLVCQSVPPIREELLKRPITNASIAALNEALRGPVAERGCEWADVRSALLDGEGALDRRFTLDGVHLTGEGYLAWARALEPWITGPPGSPRGR